jgi:signal transduction histidine kinase
MIIFIFLISTVLSSDEEVGLTKEEKSSIFWPVVMQWFETESFSAKFLFVFAIFATVASYVGSLMELIAGVRGMYGNLHPENWFKIQTAYFLGFFNGTCIYTLLVAGLVAAFIRMVFGIQAMYKTELSARTEQKAKEKVRKEAEEEMQRQKDKKLDKILEKLKSIEIKVGPHQERKPIRKRKYHSNTTKNQPRRRKGSKKKKIF